MYAVDDGSIVGTRGAVGFTFLSRIEVRMVSLSDDNDGYF